MPFKSKAQQRLFFAMANRGEIPKTKAMEWAHKTKSIKSLPERLHKKSEYYLDLFRRAAATEAVQRVKTAQTGVLGKIFGHPAVAYGLGATALGAGLPIAYGLGKQKAIEDAQRVYGISPPPQIDPASLYEQNTDLYGQNLGFYPEEGPGLEALLLNDYYGGGGW